MSGIGHVSDAHQAGWVYIRWHCTLLLQLLSQWSSHPKTICSLMVEVNVTISRGSCLLATDVGMQKALNGTTLLLCVNYPVCKSLFSRITSLKARRGQDSDRDSVCHDPNKQVSNLPSIGAEEMCGLSLSKTWCYHQGCWGKSPVQGLHLCWW